MVKVGTILYGYCGGYFGRYYTDKRVEALGSDWVVARLDDGEPVFAWTSPEELEKYTEPESE